MNGISNIQDYVPKLTGGSFKGAIGVDVPNSYGLLVLGNDKASGADGKSNGIIRMWSNTAYRMDITAPNLTQHKSVTLPDANGTLALTSDIPTIEKYSKEDSFKSLADGDYKELTIGITSAITFGIAFFTVAQSNASNITDAGACWYVEHGIGDRAGRSGSVIPLGKIWDRAATVAVPTLSISAGNYTVKFVNRSGITTDSTYSTSIKVVVLKLT